jgi:hypothetical protein
MYVERMSQNTFVNYLLGMGHGALVETRLIASVQ